MKTEMAYHHQFATRKEAKLAVFEYIEGFYNRKRRRSTLGYLTKPLTQGQVNRLVALVTEGAE